MTSMHDNDNQPVELDLSGLEPESEEMSVERRQDYRRPEWGETHHLAYVLMTVALVEEGYVSEQALGRLGRLLPEYVGDPTLPTGLNRLMRMAFLTWMGKAVLAVVDNHGTEDQRLRFECSADWICKQLSRNRLAELLQGLLDFVDGKPEELQQGFIDLLQAKLSTAVPEESLASKPKTKDPEDARRFWEWTRLHHLAYLALTLVAKAGVVVDERVEISVLDLLRRWGAADGVSNAKMVEVLNTVEAALTIDMAVDGEPRIAASVTSSMAEFSHQHMHLYNDLDALVASHTDSDGHRDTLDIMHALWRVCAEDSSENGAS